MNFFRVLSLCRNSKKKTKYGDCGEHFYDLNLRQSRLMKEVETMDPDVLCVQVGSRAHSRTETGTRGEGELGWSCAGRRGGVRQGEKRGGGGSG